MAVFPTNTHLIFQLPEGNELIDQMGNPVLETVSLVVEASVKTAANRGATEEASHETRVDMLHLEGRCNRVYSTSYPISDPSNIPNDLPVLEEINPPRIPMSIVPGVKVPCTLTDIPTGDTQEGHFILKASLPSRWSVDPILGGKVNGYFFTTNVMGEIM